MVVTIDRRRLMLATAAGLAGSIGGPIEGLSASSSTPVGKVRDPAQSSGPVVLHGASPRLTIHLLDIHSGTAATGLLVDFSKVESGKTVPLQKLTIDETGRTPEPLLIGETYQPGEYELLLHIGDYYREKKVNLPSPSFLKLAPVRFRIVSAQERTHLPVQFGPWNYTCYRGS